MKCIIQQFYGYLIRKQTLCGLPPRWEMTFTLKVSFLSMVYHTDNGDWGGTGGLYPSPSVYRHGRKIPRRKTSLPVKYLFIMHIFSCLKEKYYYLPRWRYGMTILDFGCSIQMKFWWELMDAQLWPLAENSSLLFFSKNKINFQTFKKSQGFFPL